MTKMYCLCLSEGITSGAIVGIVVAILFVIGLALGLFWKRRRDGEYIYVMGPAEGTRTSCVSQ